jgi:hypothetical protein
MPNFLSPIGNDQFIDANGDPLTGGQIETYLAGSSTPAATYTSSAGTTAQSNPIILNSLGSPTSPIWLTGGSAYKFVVKNASGSTLRTIDDIAGINDASVSQSEWVESGFVPSFVSATSFSVPGDQTPLLQIGRRLRTTNTSGLVYSTISNSVFAVGVTTVTVVNDSTALDVGLSLVAYALLAASPFSVPALPFSNITGTVPIAQGGTGATTAANAFTAIKQAATETETGVVELATTAEAAAGTDTTRAVTAAGVEAHMVANALGWGQTWQNLTGSRATATTYTNSTGRPIEVKVIYTGGGAYEATFSVDGLQVQYETRPTGAWVTVGAIVPNGSTYRATSTGTYNAWAELR